MKLGDLDAVSALQRDREILLRTMKAAASGSFNAALWLEGEKIDPFGSISAEPVRQAIIEECKNTLAKVDGQLRALGVHVKDAFEPDDGDAAAWRRTAEMYARAWVRELGGSLIAKRHFIDALVLTTREMRQKAEGATQ